MDGRKKWWVSEMSGMDGRKGGCVGGMNGRVDGRGIIMLQHNHLLKTEGSD
jgi:hypothetical protein